MKLGFVVNPIAGMGGRVGLKGTDGVVREAIQRGAEPVAFERAKDAMAGFVRLYNARSDLNKTRPVRLEIFTCAGTMGNDVLLATGLSEIPDLNIKVVFEPKNPEDTTAHDTRDACEQFKNAGVDLIVFCGGDGTARDVYSAVGDNIPILGVPSGVKMHSGVFSTHTASVGEILIDYISGDMDIADGEILDLDEDKYRAGEWNIRLFGVAKTPHDPTLVQRGKHFVESASEDQVKEEIAEFVQEEIAENSETMYILGPGSTLQAITKHLGLDGTLLGIDALYHGKLVGRDLNEQAILALLKEHSNVKLILSPIGAQGFILGRGNLQLSPGIINAIGLENIEIVSTPAKLENIEALRVDTNDPELDQAFSEKGWLRVIVGYRQMRLKRVGT